VAVIWPGLRDGEPPVPAHLQVWVAARTLEDLGVFLRSDMLTRREVMAASVAVATGAALTELVARWLRAEPASLGARDERGSQRIGASTVAAIEQATRYFGSVDAETGGALSREAAVGQLKHAVDLANHASYREEVGTRLLAAIADLSGLVGWMSHDASMNGPAQRYFVYGLQAASEAGAERIRLRAAGILADMARQTRALGHPGTGLRLIELALDRVPPDRRRFNAVRGMLWCLKASMQASMGRGYLTEVRNAVNLSFDLYASAHDDEPDDAVTDYWPYTNESELAAVAAGSFAELASTDPELGRRSEEYANRAIALRPTGFTRSRVFDQIALARARFLVGEPEQASLDGAAAIDLAAAVPASRRVVVRLRELLADSAPYRDMPAVHQLHERLTAWAPVG
jgi:hypothetical protein